MQSLVAKWQTPNMRVGWWEFAEGGKGECGEEWVQSGVAKWYTPHIGLVGVRRGRKRRVWGSAGAESSCPMVNPPHEGWLVGVCR
jgi:hypothetical protein